jgi:cytochrome c oxidase subunit 2
MMKIWGNFGRLMAAMFAVLLAGPVLAENGPQEWAMGLIDAASPVKERIHDFHTLLLYIITAIVIFVLALLIYVIVRFNEKANPVPSKTSHHTVLEVVWTVVPVLILLVVAFPSFRLLYYVDRAADPKMTIKVTGHQWYWSYEYPDNGGFTYDSYMLSDKDAKEAGKKRLLDVDNRLVIPVGTPIRVLVSSADVMHSWLVPQFGVQIYAFPGRTNETWMQASREGVFYGQCNQICGINHGFMPITIEVVSQAKFASWVEEAKKKYAALPALPAGGVQLALR